MSNPLMPEKRVNKLGHVVTKHVRSGAPQKTSSSSMPAPQLSSGKLAKKAKLKPPTPKQLARSNGKQTIPFNADERLATVIGARGPLLDRTISDYNLFRLFSIVNTDNALALASKGIEDRDVAVDLLQREGLSDLLVDHSDLMDLAVSMRAKPEAMYMLSRRYPMDDHDPEVYATAAVLAGSSDERTINVGSEYEGFLHDSLLQGRVSFEDVQELGASFLMKRDVSVSRIHLALIDKNLRGVSFSVASIKHVNRYGRLFGNFRKGLNLAETYGDDFLLSIKGIDGALHVDREHGHRPVEYRRELIRYQEQALATDDDGFVEDLLELYESGVPASYTHTVYQAREPHQATYDIITAYKAGVPAEYLTSMSKLGNKVEQIIDAHRAGVGQAIIDGWL